MKCKPMHNQSLLPLLHQASWLLWNSVGMLVVASALSQLLPLWRIAHPIFGVPMLDTVIPYLLAQYGLVFLPSQQLVLHRWFTDSRWCGHDDHGKADTLEGTLLGTFSLLFPLYLHHSCGIPSSRPIRAALRILIFLCIPPALLCVRSWYQRHKGAYPYTNPTITTFWGLWSIWVVSYLLLTWPMTWSPNGLCWSEVAGMLMIAATGALTFMWIIMTSASDSIYNPRWVITTALAGYGGMVGGLLIAWFNLSPAQWPAWGLAGLLSGSLMATITLALWPWAMDHPERHHERPS